MLGVQPRSAASQTSVGEEHGNATWDWDIALHGMAAHKVIKGYHR